jgi:hypothetical protein
MDSIVQSVLRQFQERSELGQKKYGTTLDRNDLSFSQWIQHMKEELMDAVLYMQRLKEEITNMKEEKLLRDIEDIDIYGMQVVEPDNGFWVSNTTNTHLNLRNDNAKD